MGHPLARLAGLGVIAIALGASGPGKAAAPLAVPLVMEAVLMNGTFVTLPTTLATGGVAATSALWTGVAASIGAGIAYLNLKDASTATMVRVPVNGAGEVTISPPAPSATASIPATGSPGSLPSTGYYVNPNYASSTAQGACDAVAHLTNGGHTSYNPSTNQCTFYDANGNNYSGAQAVQFQCSTQADTAGKQSYCATASPGTYTCPSGYTLSGSTCNLSNARLVTPDARVDVQRSGATYSHITSDADYGLSGQLKGTVNGDTITIAGVDANGAPISYTIKATSSGTEINQQVQTQTATGDSIVTSKTLKVDTSGLPTVTQQTTSTGTLTVDPVTQTGTVTTTGTVTATQEQPCMPGGDDQRNCEKTQQEIKKALTEKKDEDKPKDETAKSTSDVMALLPSLGLSGWAVPAHSSVCPIMSFNLGAFASGWESIAVTEHCAIMEGERDNVEPWMKLVWLLIALFVVLGA